MLESGLSLLDVESDFIAITETKIMNDVDPIFDVNLQGYQSPYQTPTESFKGGALIYVKEGIDVK